MRLNHSSIKLLSAAVVLAILLAGCGGAASTPAVPTSTPIPTYRFDTPTVPPPVATAAATMTTADQTVLDSALVATGKGRYEALACGECHGPNGEGTDKGSAMSASKQTEDEFISFMRSGGTVGVSHQYSTNRLSENGGRALYQYLLSLRK